MELLDYIPIHVSTFRANSQFTFDLFLRVNEKHLLYVRNGDDMEEARYNKLLVQNIDRLFIQRKDLDGYENFIDQSILSAIEDDTVSLHEKVEIVEGAAVNSVEAMEQMMDDPNSEVAYRMTMKAAKGLRAVLQKNKNALKKIYFQRGRNHDLILTHAKNVCALSCRFAFLLGFRDSDLDNLGAAALLHDLGINKLSRDDQHSLFKKDPKKFTPDDKRMYYMHSDDAIKMLSGRKYVNHSVLQLIEKHEENLSGTGFPNKLKDLTQIELILSLVNCYDKKVTVLGMDPTDAFDEMFQNEIGNYDLKMLQQFKDALQAEGII